MSYQAFEPLETLSDRIKKWIEEWLIALIMLILNFLSLKAIVVELKGRIASTLMYLVMKIVHISGEKLENCVDLLLIADGNESHYVYIKDLNRLDWATQFFLS